MLRRYLTICFAIVLAASFLSGLSGCATEEKKPELVYFEVDMVLPPVGTTGLMPSEINDILREGLFIDRNTPHESFGHSGDFVGHHQHL